MSLHIATIEEAKDLLSKYSAEEIRQLWENGAFGTSPKAVKDYLNERLLGGHLEKDERID